MSKGKFQFDLWADCGHFDLSKLTRDWAPLRAKVAKHGVYDSLLLALMPTASTSFLTGYMGILSNQFVLTYIDGIPHLEIFLL